MAFDICEYIPLFTSWSTWPFEPFCTVELQNYSAPESTQKLLMRWACAEPEANLPSNKRTGAFFNFCIVLTLWLGGRFYSPWYRNKLKNLISKAQVQLLPFINNRGISWIFPIATPSTLSPTPKIIPDLSMKRRQKVGIMRLRNDSWMRSTRW